MPSLNNVQKLFYETAGEQLNEVFTGFNEVQTAETTPIIALKSNYGISALRDKTETSNSGSVTNADGEYRLSTGTTTNSTAALESVERGRYIAGEVGLPGIGVRLPVLPTGEEEARWGYFDDNNGFGVGVDSTGVFIFIRRAGTETIIRREDWYDPLSANGPSGQTLSLSRLNVFRFPFRWYGSGPVVFEVTSLEREVYPSLTRFAAIEADDGKTIVEDPNLPLRAEVKNQGTSSDLKLFVAGRQFAVIGRYNPNRRFTSEYRLSQSVGTTFVPLVTFKQKPSFASVSVKAGGVSIATSSASIIYQLRINPTLTGANFGAPSEVPASETALEFDNVATALTNGQKIFEALAVAGLGSGTGASEQDIPDIDLPVNEPIVLCARSFSGTATVTSVLRAREEW